MRNFTLNKNRLRKNRAMRVRKNLRGTALRPRLSIIKSNAHLYAQLIDDETGKTLGSTSTLSKDLQKDGTCKKDKASAKKIGEKIAEIALALGIQEIVFDRGRFKYHGLLQELAEAARAKGLTF